MAYKLKKKRAHSTNYYSTSKRSKANIRFAVVHYTANDGDTDEANAEYFTRPNIKASAHYFIDDDSITESVPVEYTAYSVGGSRQDSGSKYSKNGAKYYGKCINANSVSFELCDTQKDKKNNLSKKTRENAVDFIARKMIELRIPSSNLIRHFDVTGKLCPLYFITDEDDWKKFKKEVVNKIKELNKPVIPMVTLKVGDEGKDVENLQNILNTILKINLVVDGNFGIATGKAVQTFKKKYKIDSTSTTYGSKCQNKLKELL